MIGFSSGEREQGNVSVIGVVLFASFIAGFHAISSSKSTLRLISEVKSDKLRQENIQDILSTAAIVNRLICTGKLSDFSNNRFNENGINYVSNGAGKLLVGINKPADNKGFDLVYENRKFPVEKSIVTFSMLKNIPGEGIYLSAVAKQQGRTHRSNLLIDCPLAKNPDAMVTNIALGISFEDWEDWDFNDIVMCMAGAFIFDKNTGLISSLSDQSINVFFKNVTGEKDHVLDVYDHTTNTILATFSGTKYKQERSINLTFQKDQVLRVRLTNPVLNYDFDLTYERSLVEQDSCRTEGI